VADITELKSKFHLSENALSGLDKAVSLGVRLSRPILNEIEDHPTRLYFHHYRTINMFLDQLAARVTNFIQSKGGLALPVLASQIVDWEKQFGLALDEERARTLYRKSENRKEGPDDHCTMCGPNFCAMKTSSQIKA